MEPRLKANYLGFKSELQKELGIENPMLLPKMSKIVVNIGFIVLFGG